MIDKKIHEEKAHKIVSRMAVETVDQETLKSMVNLKYLKLKILSRDFH